MTNLERNIQYLWYKGDVSHPSWLCVPLWKSHGIHIQISKHQDSGEYIIRSLEPKFEVRGFDLKEVLFRTFDGLRRLVKNSISLSAYEALAERTYDFIVRLKNSPRLF